MISFLLSVRQPVRIFLIIAYLFCIAALSLLPPKDLPQIQLFPGADKIIHFGMYFVFAILSCWTLRTEKHQSRIALIVFISVSWGVLMEIIQLEMHMGRSFSLYDILANCVGTVFGTLLYSLLTLGAKN